MGGFLQGDGWEGAYDHLIYFLGFFQAQLKLEYHLKVFKTN